MRDAGHRTPDAGHRTSDGEKSKNNISTPQGGGHKYLASFTSFPKCKQKYFNFGLVSSDRKIDKKTDFIFRLHFNGNCCMCQVIHSILLFYPAVSILEYLTRTDKYRDIEMPVPHSLGI